MKKIFYLLSFSMVMLISCDKESPFYDDTIADSSFQTEKNVPDVNQVEMVHPSILQSEWWKEMPARAQELVAQELTGKDNQVTYQELQRIRQGNLRIWRNTERAGAVSPGYPVPNPEGDVMLTSQAEVDDFGSMEYKHILGQLMIDDDASMDKICDLSPLSDLNSVGSLCFILSASCVRDLDGLHNLKTVGLIGPLGAFAVQGNNLRDISALNKLKTITGSLSIIGNPQLRNINGFSKIKTIGPGQTSATIQSSYVLSVRANGTLTKMDGLSNLRKIGGRLLISDNDRLRNIDDLARLTEVGYWAERELFFRSVTIEYNPALRNLNGLSNLNFIGGSLYINNNASLRNLNGLSGLSSIGENLEVMNNPDLNRCCGLYHLLCSNPPMCTTSGVPGTVSIIGNGTDCTFADIIANGPCS
jgi:hypothetical protein